MPEPTTVGIGAIVAYISKDGLNKMLGPTAEYLGDGLKNLVQKRTENIGTIFQKAEKKLGKKLNNNGKVPPKVLKTIIDEGSYCEDELSAEYFGGVLASSRTSIGRDDRGARISQILNSLSTYQIRTHYLVYFAMQNIFKNSGFYFNMEDRPKMQIFIPFDTYIKSMNFSNEELEQITPIVSHSFFGLHNESLIGGFSYGNEEDIKKTFKDANSAGILCSPSAFGAELYLWAHGLSDKTYDYIFQISESENQQIENLTIDNIKQTK